MVDRRAAPATPRAWRWTLFSAFLGGLAWSFVGPARLTTLGQIAPPDKLKPATIIFNLQVLVGFGLAPVVIGLVRSRYGWPAVFATGMGFFVAASLMLLGTRTRGSDRTQPGRVRPISVKASRPSRPTRCCCS